MEVRFREWVVSEGREVEFELDVDVRMDFDVDDVKSAEPVDILFFLKDY